MAMKDYYAVLGVSKNETPSGIRAAYREAVRRTHPDYAGPESSPAFQAVVEAHSVLSDPDRRREYNESLRLHERGREQWTVRHKFVHDQQPHSIFADVLQVHPSFEALAERLLRNFTGHGVPKAEKPEGFMVEVILTPEEAARGGFVAVGIPVHQPCQFCNGTGNFWPFTCGICKGSGLIAKMHPVQFPIPPALAEGMTPEVSLDALGINNLFLRVRMRVSHAPFI